jgi:TonB family protein
MQPRTQRRTVPECATSEVTLGRGLVEGDPRDTFLARSARRRAFGASLAIESTILALLIASPLLRSVAGPQSHRLPSPQLTFLGDRSHHDLIQHVETTTSPSRPAFSHPFQLRTLTSIPVSVSRLAGPAEVSAPDLPGEGVPGGTEATGIGRALPFVEPPRIALPTPSDRRPVNLSEGVLQAQLISRIEPQYPALAVQTKTQGTVMLRAIIDREGRITSLAVLSGHPLLVQAALAAVRQWRYRPTMLNGEPVEVETSITVIFRLRE